MSTINSYNSSDIAERIKLMVKEKGISVKDLLSNCDLGINTISKIANGKDILSKNLAKIADYLDCSVDYLLGRTELINTNQKFNVVSNQLTEQEKSLLLAYRQNPNMQEAVNRLLRTETNITRAVRIARSSTSTVEVVYDDFSDLDNAPETDEDL